MKRIRFLTGAHAGAQIPLPTGKYRLGSADLCDICIEDWEVDELILVVDESDTVHMFDGASTRSDLAGVLVQDFVALQFGGTTFCVGPEDGAWPSDIDLLSGMLSRANGIETPQTKRRTLKLTGVALASMMVTSMMIAGAIVAGTQSSEAVSPMPNMDALAARLSKSLSENGLRELEAKAAGNSVIVQGMVPTSTEDIAARKLIDRVGKEHVQRGYDVVQDDVRNMQESLGIEGTHVSYAGNGVFEITGTVPSLSSFHQALNNMRNDFDANVKRIEAHVRENDMPAASTPYTEMVSIGDVRYIQTPDGVKHVYPSASTPTNSLN